MNLIRFSLALLLLQASASPQVPAQTRPEDRASISGFVVKAGTGEPLAKASVVLTGADGGRTQTYTATTTSGGQFVLQNLEPGKYRLAVTRNGYVRYEYGARAPNRAGLPITLVTRQRMDQVVMPLTTAGTIAGRVFDRDGEPLANVTVQALRNSYQEGERVLNPAQTARTNDLGEYRLFWLPPGQYFVTATYNQPGGGFGRRVPAGGRGGGGRGAAPIKSDGQAEEGYVPVYYPGTTDAQSAAPITLQAGTLFSGVDLTVAAVRTGQIRVQVTDGATGQPAARATVALVPRSRAGFAGPMNGNVSGRPANQQGTYELRDIVPGSYEVVASVNDRTNRMSARTSVEIGDAAEQTVTMVLSPGFTVAGRLAIEGTPASNNADVSHVRVMLRPDLRSGRMGGQAPASAVQPDGTFSLLQVSQDNYRLSVTGMPRNSYVKLARLGANDVLNDGLRLDRAPTGSLDIVISSNTGVVDATVATAKQEPSANVTVVLVPDPARRQRSDLYRTGATDVSGHLHLEGVPPGDYKAFAWEDVEAGEWQDPAFMLQYEQQGKPVRVSEGGQAAVDLLSIPPQG